MSHLDVPGAKVYHEVAGSGPVVLCISGADGSCDIWRGFVPGLTDHYTVITWDRRGFSRSYLTGEQDYDHRIERDVDDAAELIKKYSPNEPITVIGNSSGAIIALKLLIRHPDLVKTVIPYEPPAVSFLPADDADWHWKKHQETYATYRKSGVHPALEGFAELTHAKQKNLAKFIDFAKPYMFSNTMYWFEREFMTYPFTKFDVENEIQPLKEKLLLINGEESPEGPYQVRANLLLAEKLGVEVVSFPGEHVGHATHAEAFAKKFVEVVEQR